MAGEKAAHEARRATSWSIVATLANVVGLFLVAAALGFTVISTRAAVNAVKTAHGAERPHVFLHRTIKDRTTKGEVIRVKGVNFRNVGRTPAFVTHLTVKIGIYDDPPKPLKLPLIAYPPSSAMIPDEPWPLNNQVHGGITDAMLVETTANPSRRLFAQGVVVYTDYVGKEYVLWFCRRYWAGSFAFDPEFTPELHDREWNGSGQIAEGKPPHQEYILSDGRGISPDGMPRPSWRKKIKDTL